MALRKRSRSAEPPAKRTAPTPANADRVLVCILNEDALAQFVMVQYADMPPQLAADVRERVRSKDCDWMYYTDHCDQVARRLMIAIGLEEPSGSCEPPASPPAPRADPPAYHKLYNTVCCVKHPGWMVTDDESQVAPNAYAACDVLMLTAAL